MTRAYYILDEKGEVREADLLTWARWFETADRVVRQDRTGRYTVSTVFLGLDHNFSEDGPPLLWETMIHDALENEWPYQRRYASRTEAEAGHREAMAWAEKR